MSCVQCICCKGCIIHYCDCDNKPYSESGAKNCTIIDLSEFYICARGASDGVRVCKREKKQ